MVASATAPWYKGGEGAYVGAGDGTGVVGQGSVGASVGTGDGTGDGRLEGLGVGLAEGMGVGLFVGDGVQSLPS